MSVADGVNQTAHEIISSTSFLEYAFLRWILSPAVRPGLYRLVRPQAEVKVSGRTYRVDYEIVGSEKTFAVELDGYEYHGSRGYYEIKPKRR